MEARRQSSDVWAQQIELLERANGEKKKKIQERDSYITQLQARCQRLEERLEKADAKVQELDSYVAQLREKCRVLEETLRKSQDAANNNERLQRSSLIGGYTFCLNLSSRSSSLRLKEEAAFLCIAQAILHGYPETYVGVIVSRYGPTVERPISKIDAGIVHTIRSEEDYTSARLPGTLQAAEHMCRQFRNQFSRSPFSVILLGDWSDEKSYPSAAVDFFKSSDIEVHSVIVGDDGVTGTGHMVQRIVTETGGNTVLYQ